MRGTILISSNDDMYSASASASSLLGTATRPCLASYEVDPSIRPDMYAFALSA